MVNPSAQKIKKGAPQGMTLELTENPDILAHVAGLKKPPFCVGFAAESEKLAAHARQKRRRKGIPLLAANLAQEALGADDNALTLFDDAGMHKLGRGPKLEQARKLVAHIAAINQGPRAGRFGIPGGSLGGLLAPAEIDHDIVAVFRQGDGGAAANAGSRAGYQRDRFFVIHDGFACSK